MTLLLTYCVFEDLLFEFVGSDRRRGNFCVPITETDLSEDIGKFLHGAINMKILTQAWHKYSALNLRTTTGAASAGDSVNAKGTVEFRQFGGTEDVHRVLCWINLILSMYNYAEKTPIAEFAERFVKLNTLGTYLRFRDEVFGEHSQHLLVKKAWKQMYYSGIAFVKECFTHPIRIEVPEEEETGLSCMIAKRTIRERIKQKEEVASKIKKFQKQLEQAQKDGDKEAVNLYQKAINQFQEQLKGLENPVNSKGLSSAINAGTTVNSAEDAIFIVDEFHDFSDDSDGEQVQLSISSGFSPSDWKPTAPLKPKPHKTVKKKVVPAPGQGFQSSFSSTPFSQNLSQEQLDKMFMEMQASQQQQQFQAVFNPPGNDE
jgi:hypothetical protein